MFIYLFIYYFLGEFETSSFCTFCNLGNKMPFHLFFDYHVLKSLWTELDNHFSDEFRVPTLTPQTGYLEYSMTVQLLKMSFL